MGYSFTIYINTYIYIVIKYTKSYSGLEFLPVNKGYNHEVQTKDLLKPSVHHAGNMIPRGSWVSSTETLLGPQTSFSDC